LKKRLLGIIILILLVGGAIFIKSFLNQNEVSEKNLSSLEGDERKEVKIANLSDEEFFLDEKIKEIMNLKYNFDVNYEELSNEESSSLFLNNENLDYDLIFSKKDILNNLELENSEENSNTFSYENILSTPLVIYSWDEVVDVLINEDIVNEKDEVYYITDMNKLINYILEEKKWSDLGLDKIYGNINIISADPTNTSSGASYYGLLLSAMSKEASNIEDNFPKLKQIYDKSGYMSSNEENLFDRYVRFGMTAVPMFVDYEKNIIKFANSNSDAYKQIESKIRILYPSQTIFEEFTLESSTENGDNFKNVFLDSEFQKIVLEKFGLRNKNENTEVSDIKWIQKDMPEICQILDSNTYQELISYLNENK